MRQSDVRDRYQKSTVRIRHLASDIRKVTLLESGLIAALALAAMLAAPAAAQDKVKVGVFPVSSTLPYFVAVERGFFKEQNIETEMVRLIGGPPNVAAMITNQIDASAVLVTIEGMNANIKKPGVAMYISVTARTRHTRWSSSLSARV